MQRKLYYWIFGLLICAYCLFCVRSQDSDMYQMIANGRQILAGGILYTNPTALIPSSMINQQWLYCVILALVDKFGYVGHIAFVVIQDLLLLHIAAKLINEKINDRFMAVFYALLGIVIFNAYMVNIRPQIITMILLLWHLWVLRKAAQDKRWLWLTIPIIILEANLHGAVVLYHVLVCLPFLFYERLKLRIPVLISTLCIPILACINPYGISMVTYTLSALTTRTFKYVSILELQPLNIGNYAAFGVLIVVVLFSCLLYKRRLNAQILIYSIVIICLTIYRARFLTLMMLPFVCIITEVHDAVKFTRLSSLDTRILKTVCALMMAISLVITASPFISNTYDERHNVSSTAVEPLLEHINDKNSRLYTEFDNGGYVQYMGFTNVFIDARPEIYVDAGVLSNYSLTLYGYNRLTGEYYSMQRIQDEILDRYDFDYIICNNYSLVRRICESMPANYEYVDSTAFTALYKVRKD